MNESQLQAVSGLVLSGFVLAHTFNHFLMHFGPRAHQAMFARIRSVFKTLPVLELALFAGWGTHAYLAIKNFSSFVGPKHPYFFHQASGWFLLLALPSHVFFGRFQGPKAIPEGEEYDLTYVTMSTRVLPSFFIPFYSLLTACGLIHTYSGLARAGRILNIDWVVNAMPIQGAVYVNIVYALAALGVSSALAVAGVYFRYPVKHEEGILRAVKSKLPHFLASRLDMSNNVWFSRFRFRPHYHSVQ